MIAPRQDFELLTERPPMPLGTFTRLLRPIRAILRPFDRRNDDALNAQLSALLSDVVRCETRDELEALIGKPDYAMVGDVFATTTPDGVTSHPDLVESYSRGRMRIELWFVAGQLQDQMGFLMPTAWDVLFAD